MATHKFWGEVKHDWAGFSSDISFSNPFFDKQIVEVFFGEEYDEDGEENDEPPSDKVLDNFTETFKDFTDNIGIRLSDLQQKAFERYKKVYAHYYENSEKSGKQPLNIDSVDKHNEYIKDIMYLRVLDDKTIKVTIRYKLDTEHGLEFKYVDGQIVNVGGIADM